MEEARDPPPLLHTCRTLPQTSFNRAFAIIYSFAILTLLYHHAKTLLYSPTLLSFFITFTLLIADLILAFMWVNTQALRMRPVSRQELPENLEKVIQRSDFPGLDVFICTADPYKEPPIGVVNAALSVMAYDYPTEKISFYVSDDGGSAMTLFAFMEAAKFAKHWLPFCKKNNLMNRSPEAYFRSTDHLSSIDEAENIKIMYESMKVKIENIIEKGKVDDQYINGDEEREALTKWTGDFTRHDHPSVIQVLLDRSIDRDIGGKLMPNLIYVSREKSKATPHHFKAGALNVLLRVSAVMSNAPTILTLDCDMYSNDPQTPLRAICYLYDPSLHSSTAFVQFPQRFRGIYKDDIYASEYLRLFEIQLRGLDGFQGPNHVGTGCFFRRRAFFGAPSCPVVLEAPELDPTHVVKKPIKSPSVLALAHHFASCTYETKAANWGHKVGMRYGSLVEDYYTSYRLHCEGWKSVFCNPKRPAFYGDAPISFVDMLNQQKRWAVGLLEAGLCRYSPLTFGFKHIGIVMGLCYSHPAFWSIWSIPITIYAFLPQLALLNNVSAFPEVSEPLFIVYAFLFVGSYGQDLLEFILIGRSVKTWWNDQRMWHVRGVTCFLFGLEEFILKSLGISAFGFNVTSKLLDDELSKRYEQGIFEFGVNSPMFVSAAVAALVNLISFTHGLVLVVRGNNVEGFLVQIFVAGFAVVNCWPFYEAMVLRNDKGKLPVKTTVTSIGLTLALYTAASLIFK